MALAIAHLPKMSNLRRVSFGLNTNDDALVRYEKDWAAQLSEGVHAASLREVCFIEGGSLWHREESGRWVAEKDI